MNGAMRCAKVCETRIPDPNANSDGSSFAPAMPTKIPFDVSTPFRYFAAVQESLSETDKLNTGISRV